MPHLLLAVAESKHASSKRRAAQLEIAVNDETIEGGESPSGKRQKWSYSKLTGGGTATQPFGPPVLGAPEVGTMNGGRASKLR